MTPEPVLVQVVVEVYNVPREAASAIVETVLEDAVRDGYADDVWAVTYKLDEALSHD